MSEVSTGADARLAAPHVSPRADARPWTLYDATRATYRYLRVSIVTLALLLGVSLLIELGWGTGEPFGSISGYYYSPVRSVFVGTLVAIGPALIALKGRPGWEDTLLDLAGMVIPIVAFVPTPYQFGAGVCPSGTVACVPPDLVPAVDNNVAALLVVGALGLAFAWWQRRFLTDRTKRVGLWIATGLWLAFVVWFTQGHASFLKGAHVAAATLFFTLVAGVAFNAGRNVQTRGALRGLSPAGYSAWYRAIGTLMIVVVAAALAFYGVSAWRGFEPWFYTVFAVEAVLLMLFVTFWVLQTMENWDDEAAEAPIAVARVGASRWG
jgi:hypothetical protein